MFCYTLNQGEITIALQWCSIKFAAKSGVKRGYLCRKPKPWTSPDWNEV